MACSPVRDLPSFVAIAEGEEGLNLQYAHGIVHLDLPLAPTRIEQRIGRLDRFGRELLRDRTIHHWVVSPFADYAFTRGKLGSNCCAMISVCLNNQFPKCNFFSKTCNKR